MELLFCSKNKPKVMALDTGIYNTNMVFGMRYLSYYMTV